MEDTTATNAMRMKPWMLQAKGIRCPQSKPLNTGIEEQDPDDGTSQQSLI